jgi:hypothetical protein
MELKLRVAIQKPGILRCAKKLVQDLLEGDIL